VLHDPLGHKILLIALGLELLGAFLLYRLAKSL
jgi:tight adherence protein B